MTYMGEAALDLSFSLAHNDVVLVCAYHNWGHEPFLPRPINFLVPGCAECLAQLIDDIRIDFLARKRFAQGKTVVGGDDQFSSLPEPLLLTYCGNRIQQRLNAARIIIHEEIGR